MSGGSYSYLCFSNDAQELAGNRESLERMLERLNGLPYARAAADETQRLLLALERLDSRLRGAGPLLAVWRAVEWWDSGDWGEAAVRDAVRELEDAT